MTSFDERILDNLESVGLFTRRYDKENAAALATAVRVLWRHLCRLDLDLLETWMHTPVGLLADCAVTERGYRKPWSQWIEADEAVKKARRQLLSEFGTQED